MGLGDLVGLVEVVVWGIDMFDCVLFIWYVWYGIVFIIGGKLNLCNVCYVIDD